MKRLLGLLCVFGLSFSINLKAMEGEQKPQATQETVESDLCLQTSVVAGAAEIKTANKNDQTDNIDEVLEGSASTIEEIASDSEDDDVAKKEEETSSSKPTEVIATTVPTQVQQQIMQTKWYQKLGGALKSGSLKLSNGYHKVCNGLRLIKDKTVNGAKYLIFTKTGRTVLIMSILTGYAISVELGHDPLHAQDACKYLVDHMPEFGNSTHSDL